ncbi:MAG: rhomboid family intramembrane serine protease [Deltaproteobacteria bacterium]|nr:rhomboid family intramembrane serine protease [Deltaproteobacteria bacterium]
MIVRIQSDGEERAVALDELETLIRDGGVGPETPVERGGQWIPAREWPGFAELRGDTASMVRARWTRPTVPWVTALIAGIAIRVHAASFATGGTLHAALARETPAIVERGEGWRVVGYGLLHSGLPHLLSNMTAIVVAGVAFERIMGHAALAHVILLSVATGGLASAYSLPGMPSVGMSAGDFGLLGACAALGVRYGGLLPRAALGIFGATTAGFTLWAFVNGLTAEGVDNTAHAVGLVTGVVTGAFYRPNIEPWRRGNRWAHAVVLAAVGAMVLAPVMAGPSMVPMATYEADGASLSRPSYWQVQVSRSGMRGYGPFDRSAAIAANTREHEHPPTIDEVVEFERARLARLDKEARATPIDSDHALVNYVADGVARELWLRVAVRGLHSTVGGTDTAAGARLAPRLRAAIDGWTLTAPTELKSKLDGASSSQWRVVVEAAAAQAALGDEPAALASFARARGQRPAEDDIAAAEVEALCRSRFESCRDAVARARAEFPDSSKVQAAISKVEAE